MTPTTEQTTAEKAYGKTLETPIPFSFTWDNYDNYGEVIAANDQLSQEEVVKVRNGERKAKARQAALVKALDDAGIKKPTLENDEQLRLKTMYNVFIAAKKSPEEAKALASAALGVEWTE